eukprot:maker-scaffold17_size721972-snap-gene-6.23 protein:Tk09985 transcript:maker-scaffold17_size721972-snap-gene-6.23-mRNA-1 annotation:"---NA---"
MDPFKMRFNLLWRLALVALCLCLLLEPTLGRRTGGGSRRGGGSSSRGSSSSGGMFDGFKNIFKPKPKAPQKPSSGSYPKQQYGGGGQNTNNQGGQTHLGGGGFVNPNSKGTGNNQAGGVGAGGFVNPGSNQKSNYNNNNYGSNQGYGGTSNYGSYNNQNFGRNNYGGGYYSPSGFQQSQGMFGGGGKKAFGLGVGAGFLGGAVAAAGAMTVYHQYQQYKAMMYYKSMMGGGYGGYGGMGMGYGYSPYGLHGNSLLVNAHDCVGGCPNQAFCDMAICRCREGFEARFGSCYRNFNNIYSDSSTTEATVSSDEDESEKDTLDAFPDKNLTEISANDTLKNSRLTKLNINETTPEEIKAAFCKEITEITQRFDRQVDNRQVYRRNEQVGGAALGAGAIVLIVLLVCCCCGCLCLCLCINKVKEIMGGMFDQKPSSDYTPAGEVQMNSYNDPNPPMNTSAPYPSGPPMDNPPMYPPLNGAPYPPEGGPPYIPSYQEGGLDFSGMARDQFVSLKFSNQSRGEIGEDESEILAGRHMIGHAHAAHKPPISFVLTSKLKPDHVIVLHCDQLIIGLVHVKLSHGDKVKVITDRFCISTSLVYKVKNVYNVTKEFSDRPRSGRPRSVRTSAQVESEGQGEG